MKKLNTTRTLLSIALLGAFAGAPFMTPTVQADPPKNAPAYGRRAKDKKNKKNKKNERRNDRYDRDRDSNDNRNNVSIRGTVTNVRSGNSFDLRVNDRTYNVYTSYSLPRGLSRGDEVSVYGRRYGDNDIRNASVRITDKDRDDNNGSYGAYRTYSGVVTNIKNAREFDVRISGKIYNVYASSGTRGLSRSDEVRIYGQRYGDNDIRNAKVTITRNR